MKAIYSTVILAIISQCILVNGRSSWAAERTIEGTIVDADEQPIPNQKIYIYDDNNRDKGSIRLTSDAQGAFQTKLSLDNFSIFVRATEQFDGSERLQFVQGRLNPTSRNVEASVKDETVKLLITLQRPFKAVFQLVDARSGRPVTNAAVFYQVEDEFYDDYQTTPPWLLLQVLKKGMIDFRERTPEVLKDANVLVLATGYQPLQLKLNEKLVRGGTLEKRLELAPLPNVKLTVETPEGKPATGLVFETIPPEETLDLEEFGELFRIKEQIKHLLDLDVTTDDQGAVQIEYPAFGASVSYRLRHSTGCADLSVRNLRPAGDTPIQQRIELNRYATIRGKYLPKIGPHENLELYRVLEDRMTGVSPAIQVPVDQQGHFEIGHLVAGWHGFVHRIHYGGRDERANSVSIVCFETFQVAPGQVVELTLGEQGRPVRGRLTLPAGYRHEDHLFELFMDPDINRPDYPRPPQKITDEQGLIAWWDAYWDSDTGRRFADCRVRYASTAAANDGTFYLPFVRPGTYRIGRVSTSDNLDSPLEFPDTHFTIPDDGNREPFDLGEIRILEKDTSRRKRQNR